MVLAICSMVYAGYGLLPLLEYVILWAPSSLWWLLQSAVSPSPTEWTGYFMAQLYVRLSHLLLLGAGLALYKRVKGAMVLHVAWAGLAIGLLGLTFLRLVQSNGDAFWNDPIVAAMVTTVFHLFPLAFPAGLLVWFARPRVWRQLTAWVGSRAAYDGPIWPHVIGALSVLHAAMAVPYLVGVVFSFIRWTLPLEQSLSFTGVNLAGILQALPSLIPVLQIALAAAGVLLWRRRPSGRRLHLACAFWLLIIAAAYPFLMIDVPCTTFSVRNALQPVYRATTWAIYPVFLLIWFTRPKVKRQVRGWF